MIETRLAIPAVFLLAACAASAPQQPAPPDASIVAPRVLHRVEAEYPEDLQSKGVQGNVVLAGTIPKEGGRIRDLRVVGETADRRLHQYAIDAVSQWIFSPGMHDGVPVDVEFTVTVSFREN